ncbi:hypothetical protein GQ55_9G433600 [Panicum hallii var. hallii]|uniref:Uncharacterized protein n=1 Tax=Panicum hallii var. hallii TaxID=1504633 RepID=A0A2T7CB43_9POAL|nr:hypothetical protein GQ55_9G433600 [Panicum hallii var. hallii]
MADGSASSSDRQRNGVARGQRVEGGRGGGPRWGGLRRACGSGGAAFRRRQHDGVVRERAGEDDSSLVVPFLGSSGEERDRSSGSTCRAELGRHQWWSGGGGADSGRGRLGRVPRSAGGGAGGGGSAACGRNQGMATGDGPSGGGGSSARSSPSKKKAFDKIRDTRVFSHCFEYFSTSFQYF